MSGEAMRTAWEVVPGLGTAAERLVLLALADGQRDHDSGWWPSVATLAGRCGLSSRTTQRALAALAAHGHIAIVPRHRGARQTSSAYRLLARPGEGGGAADQALVRAVAERLAHPAQWPVPGREAEWLAGLAGRAVSPREAANVLAAARAIARRKASVELDVRIEGDDADQHGARIAELRAILRRAAS